MSGQNQSATTLQNQIRNMFSTTTNDYDIPQSTVKRISQLLKAHIQDTVSQSLKRSMWRDPSSAVLDERDILHVVSKRSEKYKMKVGIAFLKMIAYKKAEDKGQNLKEYKNQENIGESQNSDTQEIEKYVMEERVGENQGKMDVEEDDDD